MDIVTLLVLIAVILFAVEAWMAKSLIALGLCLFALSFVVKALI